MEVTNLGPTDAEHARSARATFVFALSGSFKMCYKLKGFCCCASQYSLVRVQCGMEFSNRTGFALYICTADIAKLCSVHHRACKHALQGCAAFHTKLYGMHLGPYSVHHSSVHLAHCRAIELAHHRAVQRADCEQSCANSPTFRWAV